MYWKGKQHLVIDQVGKIQICFENKGQNCRSDDRDIPNMYIILYGVFEKWKIDKTSHKQTCWNKPSNHISHFGEESSTNSHWDGVNSYLDKCGLIRKASIDLLQIMSVNLQANIPNVHSYVWVVLKFGKLRRTCTITLYISIIWN